MEWNERLKSLRTRLGKSQRQFAGEINVTNAAISQWESGKRNIPGSIQKIIRMYEAQIEANNSQQISNIEKGRLFPYTSIGKALGKQSLDWSKVKLLSLFKSKQEIAKIQSDLKLQLNREIFNELSKNRGLSMKIGQMFSSMSQSLPEDFSNYIKKYQYNFRSMDWETISKQIERGLKKPLASVFAEIHQVPFAGGSIGQVHWAKTHDGKEVALKVQYPAIVEELKKDLNNLSSFTRLIEKFFWFGGAKEFTKEIEERILEETDYRREMQNYQVFKKAWASDSYMYFPEIYPELCSETTLAMEYIDGMDFYEFLENSTEPQREKASKALFAFHFESIYQHKIYNCDPHPGNYLFRDGQIVFIDFGCVKYFKADTTELMKSLWLAAINDDFEPTKVLFKKLGLVANEKHFDFEFQYQAIRHLLEPVLQEKPSRINHHYVKEIFRSQIQDNPNLAYSKINPDFVFLQRLQFGLYSLLADLDAKILWRDLYLKAIRP